MKLCRGPRARVRAAGTGGTPAAATVLLIVLEVPKCDEMLTRGSLFRSISAFASFHWVGTGRSRPPARCPAEPGAAGHPHVRGPEGRFPGPRSGSCGFRFIPNEPG